MVKETEARHGSDVRVCPRCRAVYSSERASCGLDGVALEDHPGDPLIGHAIDRYEVLELLGEGAVGRVYAARHAVLDRDYAIKVLYGDHAAEPKFRERFRREAQSISRIRHPNIVTVEDFGETPEGLMFLVLERVGGESLDRLIDREAPLTPTRARTLVRQLAAGLGAAHALGFVHRDVKPANVMVVASPEGSEQVKILDFGTVSLLSVPRDQRLTRLGHLIGTPTYMAPEQGQDPGVTPAADLYGLGVVLYEMLTGHPPFRGENRTEVLLKHATETPPRLPPCEGLEEVVALCLEKDPARRPTAAALAEALGPKASPDTPDRFGALDSEPVERGAWQEWARTAGTFETRAFEPSPGRHEGPAGSPSPAANAAVESTLEDEAELLYEPSLTPEPTLAEAAEATQVDVPLEALSELRGTEVVPALSAPAVTTFQAREDLPYEDELPTVAAPSGPNPVVPVPLTQEDADGSSGGGRPAPERPPRAEPRRHRVHRGSHEADPEPVPTEDLPTPLGLDRRATLERWLLPLTVGLLVAATLALVGALAHRGLTPY